MTTAEIAYQAMKNLPSHLHNEVLDFIEFVRLKNNLDGKDRANRLKQIMQVLAASKPFADLDNPSEWQQQVREYRELPR